MSENYIGIRFTNPRRILDNPLLTFAEAEIVKDEVAMNVKAYGAKGDGITDDTAAIQAALNSTNICALHFPAGTYKTTSQLNCTRSDFIIDMCEDSIINLVSTTNQRIISFTGSDITVNKGQFTTTNRNITFMVYSTGNRVVFNDSKIYFATKATSTSINYGISNLRLDGTYCVVKGVEVYNSAGLGITLAGANNTIENSVIRDNFTGIFVSQPYCTIRECKIIDNNVAKAEGASSCLVTAGSDYFQFSDNITANSGEHGIYCYADHAVISNNRSYGHNSNGLKIRDSHDVSLIGNTVSGNNKADGSLGEIEVQVSGQDMYNITISDNVVSSSSANVNKISIKISYGTNTNTVNNVVIEGNSCETIWGACNSNLTVSNNTITIQLVCAVATANAPNPQINSIFSGNNVRNLSLGRCDRSLFENNIIGEFDSGTGRNNIFLGNHWKSTQTVQINRRAFSIFSNNYCDLTSLATSPYFIQAGGAPDNDNKTICNNNFVNCGANEIYEDTSDVIAGDNCIIVGNRKDGTGIFADMWGDGHFISGNLCYAAAGSFILRGDNGFAVGNLPSASSLGTNNVNIIPITGWDTTTVGLNRAQAINATTITATDADVRALASVVNAMKQDLIAYSLLRA